jgi:bifunctional non-homologous end joining protein LigD
VAPGGRRARSRPAVDDAAPEDLREYRRKRDFAQTPEPAGGAVPTPRTGERMFVIQKHAATRLHYDFRLELEGTLKSWAVPKGPSLDPADKRLAMHVEDHPLEYATFEGIIPKGEYGGGTVVLWDRGTWEPEGDPHKGYHSGNLKFALHGEKLRGSWALVRIRGGRDPRDDGRSWLLIKHGDAEARPAKSGSIVEARPESVATGRTLEQIAVAADRVWHSNGRCRRESPPARRAPRRPRERRQVETAGRATAASRPRRRTAKAAPRRRRCGCAAVRRAPAQTLVAGRRPAGGSTR